jgi:hypothetical protein
MTDVDPVEAHFNTIRTYHVAALAALQDQLRSEHGEVVAEALVETDDPNLLEQTMRIDAIVAGPKVFELEIEPVPGLGFGMSFELHGTTVFVSQFSWNSCWVKARVEETAGRAALCEWARRWLDLEDKRPTNKFGFSEVIHAVRSIAYTAECLLVFQVDFGSSSTDSLYELVTSLVESGADLVGFFGEASPSHAA